MTDFHDLVFRFWPEIVARASGPFHLRFILQPLTASILAMRDGFRDAQKGQAPYIWSLVHETESRSRLFREGMSAVARVFIAGMVVDGIYQFVVFDSLRPGQMLVVALVLAFLPYLLLRGPADRIARWLKARQSPSAHAPQKHIRLML